MDEEISRLSIDSEGHGLESIPSPSVASEIFDQTITFRTTTALKAIVSHSLDETFSSVGKRAVESIGMDGFKYNFFFGGKRISPDLRMKDLQIKPKDHIIMVLSREKEPSIISAGKPITQEMIDQGTRHLKKESSIDASHALDLLRIIAELEEKQTLLLQAKEQISRLYAVSYQQRQRNESTNPPNHAHPSTSSSAAQTDFEASQEEGNPSETNSSHQEQPYSLEEFIGIPGLPSILPEQLQPLLDMGFSAKKARKALYLEEMSVPRAITRLLSSGDDDEFEDPFSTEELVFLRQLFEEMGPLPLHVHVLMKRGFDEASCISALKEKRGDFYAASQVLVRARDVSKHHESGLHSHLGSSGQVNTNEPHARLIARQLFEMPIFKERLSDADILQDIQRFVEDPTILPEILEKHPELEDLFLEVNRFCTEEAPEH
eukprot:TRINITY_DN9434_c0_g1_i1.p1 TRINITY_DN9434_c0_g1~~TRINITY_DN9434_c0_g1_i1.p1  ORF type:complete len:433 (+),score=107.59 TRINITY_DN9434_c0_g1_i1:57-1355(+)